MIMDSAKNERRTSSSHIDIPKNDNGQYQKWKVDYSI